MFVFPCTRDLELDSDLSYLGANQQIWSKYIYFTIIILLYLPTTENSRQKSKHFSLYIGW